MSYPEWTLLWLLDLGILTVVYSDANFLTPTECSQMKFSDDSKLPGVRVRPYKPKGKVPNKTALNSDTSLKFPDCPHFCSADDNFRVSHGPFRFIHSLE